MMVYKDQVTIEHPTLSGLDEQTKIQYLIDGTKPTANLKIAIYVASQSSIYENCFVEFLNYIGSKVERSKSRSQYIRDYNRRNISQADRGNGNGREGDRTGRGRYLRMNTGRGKNNKPGKFVYGKWITDKFMKSIKKLIVKIQQ